MGAFWAVSERRSTTMHSFIRLPSMSMEMRGAAEGRRRQQSMVMVMGKMTFSTLVTFLVVVMRTRRSFLVVSALMMGGWMMGTSAM